MAANCGVDDSYNATVATHDLRIGPRDRCYDFKNIFAGFWLKTKLNFEKSWS
jgi:hypothetical protein